MSTFSGAGVGLSGVDRVDLERGGAATAALGGEAVAERQLGQALQVEVVAEVQGERPGVAHYLPERVALVAGPGTQEVEALIRDREDDLLGEVHGANGVGLALVRVVTTVEAGAC